MESQEARNKRLARNTVVLYVRMLFTTVIGLFTSRIVLQYLGITDYGVYNVVGGVVVMIAFIQTALGNGTSRFITVALGENNVKKLESTYSTTVLLHAILAFIVFVFAETVGVWFFYKYLNIPASSLTPAMWAYQLSIITTLLSILCVPDNSLIIAHEKMNAFAFVSIFESLARFAGAFLLSAFDHNRLIIYALILCIIQVLVRIIYSIYCKIHFPESKFVLNFDRKLAKEITGFSGYIVLPGFGAVCCAQGLNILLNLFAGPAANAARGIAVQVQALLTKFTQSFQQATSPQIMKLCAANQFEQMHSLITKSSKFSFFIMLLPFVPMSYGIETLLNLWLVEVPEYTVEFCRFTLVITILSTIDFPFLIGASAEGHIKKLYSLGGLFSASVVPIAYIALKLGAPIISVYVVYLVIHLICIILELKIGGGRIGFGLMKIVNNIVVPILLTFIISMAAAFVVKLIVTFGGLVNFIVSSTLMVLITSIVIYVVGVNKRERKFLNERLSIILSRIKNIL